MIRKIALTSSFFVLLASTLTFTVGVGTSPSGADEVPWTPSAAQAPLPTTPLPDGGTPDAMDLSATSCSSSSFCVAVGWVSDGVDNIPKFPLAETYSGGVWTPSVLPVPSDTNLQFGLNTLVSVSCATDGACAAVGDYSFHGTRGGNVDYQSGLLEQLTSGAWTATAAPLPSGPDSVSSFELTSVSCSDAVSCVAVASAEDNVTGLWDGLIYTLSSGTWQLQIAPVPPDLGNHGVYVTGVSCPDNGDCVAVGYYLDSSFDWHALIYTLAAGVWTVAIAPAPPDLSTVDSPDIAINGVDCPQVGSCVAVGFFVDANSDTHPLLLQQSSGIWTPVEGSVPSDSQSDTLAVLNGIYCPAVGSCVSTGSYWTDYDQSGGESGLILSQDGGSWTATSAPLPPGQNEPAKLNVPNEAGRHVRNPKYGLSPALTRVGTSIDSGDSLSLSGVGCSTAGFCTAAGADAGSALLESGSLLGLPSVSGISPALGPIIGGTPVTIMGINFGPDSVVSFGGTQVATKVLSPTELQTSAPAWSSAQSVDATVTTGGLESRANLSDRFSYIGAQSRVGGYSMPITTSSAQRVKVTFTVPTASCGGLPKKWGTQAVDAGARIITAVGDAIGGVIVRCSGRAASYSELIEINGEAIAPKISVGAGQVVTATVAIGSTGTTVTVSDGPKDSQTAAGEEGDATSVDVGALAADCTVSNCASVPKTTPIKFSAIAIDGLNPFTSGATSVNLEDASGNIEVAVAKADEAAFKLKWTYSCSTTTRC